MLMVYSAPTMNILAIETSCDETGIALVEAHGGPDSPVFSLRGNALVSQIDIHAEYGGVFPNLAKREHARALVPVMKQALSNASALEDTPTPLTDETREKVRTLCSREEGLADAILDFFAQYSLRSGSVDLIAVTVGPGLEPALWVGIQFARALATILHLPLTPAHHMEGHIYSTALTRTLPFPALALLV